MSPIAIADNPKSAELINTADNIIPSNAERFANAAPEEPSSESCLAKSTKPNVCAKKNSIPIISRIPAILPAELAFCKNNPAFSTPSTVLEPTTASTNIPQTTKTPIGPAIIR